ncbi:MAG: hypothetical protein L3J44_00275 [Campylobacteraceae bacterium]|nr:hypothetical protein [Campylobacteraceae bacterium]
MFWILISGILGEKKALISKLLNIGFMDMTREKYKKYKIFTLRKRKSTPSNHVLVIIELVD